MNDILNKKRCFWVNLNNPLYIKYHDEEWGVRVTSDQKLFELLILESFQAGLSWECILNKREAFRLAFDGFDPHKVALYSEIKIQELVCDPRIVRNRCKIEAAINNAKIFIGIVCEFGSFANYLESICGNVVVYEVGCTRSSMSDLLAKDLSSRGMKFVGSVTMYSYLQAIGIVNSHGSECFLCKTARG